MQTTSDDERDLTRRRMLADGRYCVFTTASSVEWDQAGEPSVFHMNWRLPSAPVTAISVPPGERVHRFRP
jgi:hypothetical protein